MFKTLRRRNRVAMVVEKGENCKEKMIRMERRRRTRLRRKTSSISRVWICFLYFLSCTRWTSSQGSLGHTTSCTLLPHAFALDIPPLVGAEKEEEKASNPRLRSRHTVPSSQNRTSLNQILIRAGKRGLGGGIPGALAGLVQVITLMWLRTIVNYQSRYGTTFAQAFVTLMNDGGIRRLYRGLMFALIQAPLARFVSTAANDGVDSLLASFPLTESWGPGRKTVVASMFVGVMRIVLMRK